MSHLVHPALLRALLGACLLAVLFQAPRVACAQDSAAEPSWYGWQTLVSDASAFGLIALGAGTEQPPIAVLGLATYLAGAPIIHAVHGNGWALRSGLLRFGGVSLMGAGVVVAFAGCPLFDGETCNHGQRELGAVIATTGLLVTLMMPILDGATARRAPPHSQIALSPWLTPRGDAGGLSLSGRL